MYETRGYPVDVVIRDHRSRDRSQRRAYRVAAIRTGLRRLTPSARRR